MLNSHTAITSDRFNQKVSSAVSPLISVWVIFICETENKSENKIKVLWWQLQIKIAPNASSYL